MPDRFLSLPGFLLLGRESGLWQETLGGDPWWAPAVMPLGMSGHIWRCLSQGWDVRGMQVQHGWIWCVEHEPITSASGELHLG